MRERIKRIKIKPGKQEGKVTLLGKYLKKYYKQLAFFFIMGALALVLVDIVETGATLRENHLEVIETIVPISARLIANKSGFKFKREPIERLKNSLENNPA